MKHILFSLIILFTYASSFAQSIEANNTSVNVQVTLDNAFYEGFGYIVNNTSSAIDLEWERTVNDLPSGWTSQICIEGGTCYLPNIGGSPSSEVWSVPANDSVYIEVRFQASPSADQGVANVVLRVTELGTTSPFIDYTFVGESTSSTSLVNKGASINVFPNPAANYIMLSDAENVEIVELYNIVGAKVKTFYNVAQGQKYDVSNLPKGMYLIRLLDSSKKIVTTKRISKR